MKKSMRKRNSFWRVVFVTALISLGLISLFRETVFKTGTVLAAQDTYSTALVENSTTDELPQLDFRTEINPQTGMNFSVKVPVLMYHYVRRGINPKDKEAYFLSVTPENLDSQFAFLTQNNFQTISLNDLYDSLTNRVPLPPKSVVITFDDGYRDFYTDAFPIIKKYNLRVVSFYVADYVTYPGYMNWDMLREINNSGLVDIESHTLHHPNLTKISLVDARREIFDSKKVLEQGLGKKVNYFNYPYGAFNPLIVNLVQQAGYKMAFSTLVGNKMNSSEMFFLRRISVTGSDTIQTFSNKLFN